MPYPALELNIKTTTVLYSDKLLSEGGTPREIPAEEFAEQNGFTWTDNPLIDDSLTENLKAFRANKQHEQLALQFFCIFESDKQKATQITLEKVQNFLSSFPIDYDKSLSESKLKIEIYLNQIKENASKLVVCDINKRVGKGVFLNTNSSFIPENTAIAIYSGVYRTNLNDDFMPYGLSTSSHPLFDRQTYKATGVTDASTHGNITHFIQSAPDENELKTNYKLQSSIKKETVATANIKIINTLYDGMPISIFVASRDILPGEQLCFSYGPAYWSENEILSNAQELLFNTKGELLPEDSYERMYLTFPFEYQGKLKGVCKSIPNIVRLILTNQDLTTTFISGNTCINFVLRAAYILEKITEKLANANILPNSILDHLNNLRLTVINKKTNLDHKEQFIYILKICTLTAIVLNACDTENNLAPQKHAYAKEILDTITHHQGNQANQANEIFTAVRAVLTDQAKKSFYKEHLGDLRLAIIKAMTEYNTKNQAANNPTPRLSM